MEIRKIFIFITTAGLIGGGFIVLIYAVAFLEVIMMEVPQ